MTLDVLILAWIGVGTLGGIFGGPALGDHEALVAQSARDMRMSGDWLVPHYLGDPYVRKPPLPYWLIAGLSYLFSNQEQTGLPVTTLVARLPSALAALGTVLLLWRLGGSMFGRKIGRVTAILGASSLFFLLYAANATVEMILTFCCTWAHVHFWFAIQHAPGSSRRRWHLFLFYLAMGLGMMAKGPFPLVMVAMPIAVWWYAERPLRILARSRGRDWRAPVISFLRGLWPQTRRAVRDLWLVPGLIVFGLCFVPWMIAVGAKHPDAWDLWNWQYWQRAQGQYEDTRPRSVFYYVPVIGGLVLPWLFLVFEAIVAPWIGKYARQRRGLLYAGLWALVGAVVMSLMTFKKPYYVGPVIPGLMLMLGVVAERFYASAVYRPRLAKALWMALVVGAVGLVVGGHLWLREEMPRAANGLTMIAGLASVGLILAGTLFLRGRRWYAFALTGATFVLAFHGVWYGYGRMLDNADKVVALARVLDENDLPQDASIFWVDRRPDARLSFYYGRWSQQMIKPAEVVQRFVDRTTHQDTLERLVMNRARELLASSEPVYLVLDRKEYQLAHMIGMDGGACVIGEAKDPDRPKNDWIVLANAAAAER